MNKLDLFGDIFAITKFKKQGHANDVKDDVNKPYKLW